MRPHSIPAEAIRAAWLDTSVGLLEHGKSLGVSSSWLSRQARFALGLSARDVQHLRLRKPGPVAPVVRLPAPHSESAWTPPLCAKPEAAWSPARRAAERWLNDWNRAGRSPAEQGAT